jgi:hypothetical protein
LASSNDHHDERQAIDDASRVLRFSLTKCPNAS